MEAEALFNPFPGLRSFEPEEDHLFFGREKQIDELLRRLRSSRFLCVLGTSGCGKSSLVRCGLIPALHGGFMVKAGSGWRVAVFRPGENPLRNLAAALNEPDALGSEGDAAATNGVLLEVTLRRSTLGLVEALRQAQIPPTENLLVIVDQFEELFRFRQGCQNENLRDEAVAFVKLLLEATQQDEVPIFVVLTMRSDFIGECMEYPGLPEAVNAGLYLVSRMTREELRSAITGPVAVGGGKIAPRLVLRLLNEIGDDQDQLPVLQHALMRTWDHWQHGGHLSEPIDVEDYEAIGTMSDALSKHAEEAYEETGPKMSRQRLITERMFKALTDTFTDQRGVRRPTSVRDLAAISDALDPEVIQIVEIFRQRGRCFLMPPAQVPLDSRSMIDISHESLMRCWRTLISWAEEERTSAEFYMRLSKDTAYYEEGIGGLWRDPELEFGLHWWVENDPTRAWAERYDGSFMHVVEFLDRSKKERDRLAAAQEYERKKKLRQAQWAAGILGTLLLGFVYLAYVAFRDSGRARANLAEARTAVDEMLLTAGSQTAPEAEAADVPQMMAFRKELVSKAQTFYLDLAHKDSGDAGVRAGMAQAHSRLGDIDRLLNQGAEAATEYNEAIQDYTSLAKQYPANPEYPEALGYAYNFLGETLHPQPSSASDAEKAYGNALQIQQELVNKNQGNAVYQQELARTYYNRGILRHDTNQPNDSESDFNEAIQLLAPLAQKSTDPSTLQELARVYNNLGVLLNEKNQKPQAATNFEEAIAIDEGLVKKKPEDRENKLELATYYNNFAMLLLDEKQVDMKQVDMAKQYSLQTLDLFEDLAAPSPTLSIDLAKVHTLRARLLENHDPKEAQADTQKSMEILEKLKKNQDSLNLPEIQGVFRDLGYTYVQLADRSLKSGSRTEAQADLDNLSRLIPEVSEQDRTALNQIYQQLHDKMIKPN